ncbi:MAG: polysaccharide biosynthesis C-terminal domain-containing protein [Thermoplasmata archaeon]|nr:polysaccharide biosynthesis C-terminal domain-containing protein [Thermoplasmata archaeon]
MTEAPANPEAAAPPASLTHERSLGFSSSAVFILTILIQGIGYAATFFTSHKIGGTGAAGLMLLSIAGFYLLIASTINGLGDLRIGSAFQFQVARGAKAEDSAGTYFALRLGMVAVLGGVLLAVNLLVPLVTGGNLFIGQISPSTAFFVFGIFLLMPLFWSPGVVYTNLWIARGDSIRAQYPLLIQAIVQTIGLITTTFIATGGNTAFLGVTLSYLAGALASAAFCLPVVLAVSRRPNWVAARRMFLYAWPLIGGLLFQYVLLNTIPFLVQADFPGKLTIFLAANAFRIVILGISGAVAMPLFPHLANLHVRREYEALRRRTWSALRYTAILVVPVTVSMVVYRVNLLDVLNGANYTGGSVPLAILALSAVPAALTQVISTALTSVGRQRLELYLGALQVGLMFGSALLFMPPYAPLGGITITLWRYSVNLGLMNGAAMAVLIAAVGGLALNVYFMERLLAVRIQPRPILLIIASAASSFYAVSLLNNYIDPTHWYTLLLAAVIGFAVYFLVLAGTGEFSRQDVQKVIQMLGLPVRLGTVLGRFCWRVETRDAGEILLNGRDLDSDGHLDQTRGTGMDDSRKQKPGN